METMLMNNGFTYMSESNEYKRDNWTIRFSSNTIEVFNDPEISDGKYYSGPINKVDLQQLIQDINEFDNL